MMNSNFPLNLDALIARAQSSNGFIVRTPPITKLYAEVKNLITTGRQGGILWGRFRIGKTSATRWVLNAYQTTLGDIPYVDVPCRFKENRNWAELEFFQYLLERLKSNYAHVGRACDKRHRVKEALIELGNGSQYKTVILFLDEAQFLGETQFEWLVNIANELDADGIRLFCMLVGNQQLRGLSERLLKKKIINGEETSSNHEHIYGRFALQEMQIRGLRQKRDVVKFVSDYCSVVYPPQYKMPIIHHFIPYAFSANRIPDNLGEMIWDRFYIESLRATNGEANTIEIPMTYLCAAILQLLNILKDEDGPNLILKEEHVVQAINLSGYVPGLKNRDIDQDDSEEIMEQCEDGISADEPAKSDTFPNSADYLKSEDGRTMEDDPVSVKTRGKKRSARPSSDYSEKPA